MKKTYLTILIVNLLPIIAISLMSCTIFVLTDTRKTYFFNNEDWKNPATRIWFTPGTGASYGTACLGFDNNFAQGGVNTRGLAYDWIADGNYVWDFSTLTEVKGNPSAKMLETCATVEEAISFYQKFAESGFKYARVLVADKTGASAIIEARAGKLYFDRSNQSRGFGYGKVILEKQLTPGLKPSLKNGLPILTACRQQGDFGTKYSNIFDLRTGDIALVSSSSGTQITKLNLQRELSKGIHYYDLPNIKNQLKQPLLVFKSKP